MLITTFLKLTSRNSIIQDCEDSLTNWVEQAAAVSSKLSTRTRTLSQRRKARAEGVDLSSQDPTRESGMWVPAGQHAGFEGEEEELEGSVANGAERGRQAEVA